MYALEPKYPWEPGSMACCSGVPFLSEELQSVSTVDM